MQMDKPKRMRHIKQILLASVIFPLLAVATSSCSDDVSVPGYTGAGASAIYDEEGALNVTFGLELPDMTVASSRAMGDEPNFTDLGLYMLVFEEGEGMVQYARLSNRQTPSADESHENAGLVKFTARLWPTVNNVVIHLIATDQPNFSEQIGSGMMESSVATLYTDNGYQAYWQRIDLGSNIPSKEQSVEGFDPNPDRDKNKYDPAEKAKAEAIVAKLNHVPMVRNFCKVSVRFGNSFGTQNYANEYEITGLYIINTVDRGTVAAYRASYTDSDGFVEFYDNKVDENNRFVPYTYRIMTDDPNVQRPDTADAVDARSQHYVGNLPQGVNTINKDVAHPENIASKSEGVNPGPVYLYERPAMPMSEERTYAVVRIAKGGTDSYYKIDLGHVWDPYKAFPYMGVFDYYNLLRNFHYEIKINRIDGEGYESLEKAAAGAVFNNISSSVDALRMTSISDGDDWIYVSTTSYVFTYTGEELKIYAQYRTGVNEGQKGGTVENNKLQKPVLSDENSFIEIFEEGLSEDGQYKIYKLRCTGIPTNEPKELQFYIYRGPKNFANGMTQDNVEYGLYRVVTLYMHAPWSFMHMDTYPGLWESFEDFSWDWSDEKREVGQYAGSPLTLFFELPRELPYAIFPLDFVIESDRQNIQNAYQGNAVVQSVPAGSSLFYKDWTPKIGQPQTSRIQYVKTVTWEEYNGNWSLDYDGTGNKVVRCRFLTITDLNQDVIGQGDDGTASETTLRVYNPYFGSTISGVWKDYSQDGFKRDSKTSDPSPRFWDFSSGVWDEVILALAGNHQQLGSANSTVNNTIDELSVIEGAANSMSSGTDSIGRYIQTSNANDRFSRYLEYSTTQERTMRILVTTNSDTAPKITFTAAGGNVPTAPSGPESKEVKGGTTTYEYIVIVPKAIEKFTMNIQPGSAAATRFYSIDFFPRWDEMPQATDGD